jgi:hypothetical protein
MINNELIDYDDVDIELRDLCKALNNIKNIQTSSCCFGHGEENITIYFNCTSITTMNHFMWAFCHRYGCISTYLNSEWKVLFGNGDTDRDADYLHLVLVGVNGLTRAHCDDLADRINEWLNESEWV